MARRANGRGSSSGCTPGISGARTNGMKRESGGAAANNCSQMGSRLGLVEWFRPGEYERVESVLADARTLGIRHLRTGVSWADWYASEGDGWYAWLLPRLSSE